jgi:hypothetical protein
MDMLNALVQKKVAELLAANESIILQPFLQTQSVRTQLRKIQSVIELNKFRSYFQDWGCLICGSLEQGHLSLGMCPACHGRTVSRMQRSMKRATTERAQDDGRVVDLEQLAQDALMPAIVALKPERRKLT